MDPSFPGFENLFKLRNPWNRRAYFALFSAEEESADLSRAETTPTRTPQVTWDMGTAEPGDVVWTSDVFPLVVHARVVDVLDRHHLTGWDTFDVDVYSKSGRRVPDYHGIAIHGRCGRVDLSRSAIELRLMPRGWWPDFRGHFFDEGSWDGSDLFMDRPDSQGTSTGFRFVSRRVVDAFSKAKVRNIAFCALSEERVATTTYSIGSSHLLPPDFSERLRAAYATAGVEPPSWIVEKHLRGGVSHAQ